jgi:hypothetical protein
MALILKHLLDHVRDTLGGSELPSDLDPISVINQAGEHLHSMHAWRWAQGRSTLLSLRGTTSGTDATWVSSTLTLTSTGAFTDYTFVDGDQIEITDGTVTTGFYTLASRVSANAVTLTTSIGADATDVDFTLQPYSIDLPDDLRDIISIVGTTSIQRRITLSSLTEVLERRNIDGPNDSYWYGAVSYVGSPPTPILEIGPASGSNVTGAFRLFYRARWARLSTDNTSVDVPEFVEALLVQLVRAFARAYVREDQGSLTARLAEIDVGPLFVAARRSDGNIQPYFGTLRNGGPVIWRRNRARSNFYETTSRIDPPI